MYRTTIHPVAAPRTWRERAASLRALVFHRTPRVDHNARAWSSARVSLALAAYLLCFANVAFWTALWHTFAPVSASDLPLLAAVAAALLALFWLLLHLVAWRGVAKPAWGAIVLLAATAAYFMDSYGLVVDRVAIQSVFETDPREAAEWVSLRMLPYLILAIVPMVWLARVRLVFRPWPREVLSKLGVIVLCVACIAGALFLNFARLSSTARNHRELQHLVNPTTVLQSTYGYLRRLVAPRPTTTLPVGADARLGATWTPSARPRLLVVVIGESARASSFSLLGYGRDTNPRLAADATIDFTNVHSCGTSTAVSLPCMFSNLGQADYSDNKARGRESVLDVLKHAGVRAAWLDNNTGSKGIAARIDQHFLANDTDPRFCNATGCFDDLLVDRLGPLLDAKDPPHVVVLHQKGSHGPSYFERYPPEFRKFVPTCDSNELDDCTREQIVNTYDNSILYTDHNLAEVIALLRRRGDVDSAMLYVSDHGESTGENGMYLHGAPLFMAPAEQTHVPMILWLSDGFAARDGIDVDCLRARSDAPLSHDNLFHSVLGLMDVATSEYRADRDLVASCRRVGLALAADQAATPIR